MGVREYGLSAVAHSAFCEPYFLSSQLQPVVSEDPMPRFIAVAAACVLGIVNLFAGSGLTLAQAKAGANKAAAKTAAPAKTAVAEPATPEQAAKVLDLRTFPLIA